MNEFPSGTVTFLFTDIEGSTKIAEQFPAVMPTLLAPHNDIVNQAIGVHNGHVFQIIGDAFCVAFHTVPDALGAALDAQRALQHEAWNPVPLRVRMGINTGVAEALDSDYRGYLTLTRVQRVMSLAHGGQILLSNAIAELVRGELPPNVTLRDMHAHRLKGLINPEHLWQVDAPDLPHDFPPLESLNVVPNNLPVQLTSFVGREKELADLKKDLSAQHLVTLTGPGGTGKTRLSLQIAAEVLDTFMDGIWFIELAPLADPALVVQTVAAVLNVSAERNRPLLATLTDSLREKSILLILDNCEHLIEACAQLAEALLQSCPRLKILASSREALGIAGEKAYRVPSLAMPPAQAPGNLDALTHYDAVRLFIERAVAARADFQVTNANAPAVAQVCQRLDGIPLALELAAARVKVLKVEQIAARLDDRFRLLTGGRRTALPRLQTLRALIDWSYDLLSDAERLIMRRLAVFVGGWTLEAAEQVCAEGDIGAFDVLDLLTRLVDKSLVVIEDTVDAVAHYRFLETIRQYARDKLLESGEGERVRDRHLTYWVAYSEQVEPKLWSPEREIWFARLNAELDNYRAALEWGLTRDAEAALQIAGNLMRFWSDRNHALEGLEWLRQTLTRFESLPPAEAEVARGRMHVRAGGLLAVGSLNIVIGDHQAAQTAAAESVQLYRALGDQSGLGRALFVEGAGAVLSADPPAGIRLMQEGVAIARVAQRQPFLLANLLAILGEFVARFQGDFGNARAYLEEALSLQSQFEDYTAKVSTYVALGFLTLLQKDYVAARENFQQGVLTAKKTDNKRLEILSRSGLADVARLTGDSAKAGALYKEVILDWREFGNRGGIARCIECLAFIAGNQARAHRAVTLLGAAATIRETNNMSMASDERLEYDAELPSIRTQLDDVAFNALWTKGKQMTLEQAVAYAVEESNA